MIPFALLVPLEGGISGGATERDELPLHEETGQAHSQARQN